MTTAQLAGTGAPRTSTAVRSMLRDIGYVLWLSRMIAKEIETQERAPVRPEMSECCEFEMECVG
ncbi:MAG: hypothetical protein ACJ8C4_07725 [Gemmataceae bacterium]